MAQSHSEAVWHPANAFFLNRAPNKVRAWLKEANSLTKQVVCQCPGLFRVKVDQQYLGRAYQSEANALQMNVNCAAFIREVHLFCNDQAWVFARTIIPITTLRGELQKLTQLGSQPLGAVLFAKHTISRGSLEIAKIKARTPMYAAATRQFPQQDDLWGRRRLFYLGDKPLLVNEIFLDSIPKK